MKKSLSVICCSLFLSFFSLSAYSVQEQGYQAYREYFPLNKKVEYAPQIVIFFSFASRESGELIDTYKKGLVRDLKKYGYTVELVPVDFYSPYDNFLADKWCIEDLVREELNIPGVLSTEDYVSNEEYVSAEQYFSNVLYLMGEYKSSGLEASYNKRMESLVKMAGYPRILEQPKYVSVSKYYIEECYKHRKELIENFNVTSVPSVYVNGKYLINEAVMSTRGKSNSSSLRTYLPLIDYLLHKKDD